ncbi:MAG: ribonuclease R family protein, partial [Burkholderiales bacterium]
MNTKTTARLNDPFLEREKQKYPNPLPSREFILETLAGFGVPVSIDKLSEALGIEEHETDSFSHRLRAMERDGQIMKNRKGAICVVEKLDLVKGVVQGHPDGFGFLVPDDGSSDLFLGPKEMHKVFHGDRVMVREIGMDRRGRREASIVEVLERANTCLVGRLYVEHSVLFVVAENRRINQDILVPPGEHMGAQPGQVVMIEIIEQPSKRMQPIGRVVEILGNYADPGMEIEIALRKHDLPHAFPIADVSHYVKAKGALDVEALKRGNSVYFPRRVIPMLPEALSNELCSINPGVDRLCMVCEMELDAHGEFQSYRFYSAVMHSHARLTYTKVAAMLENPASAGEHAGLLPNIQLLYTLYGVLAKARQKRGAIDFETIETQMVFNDQGKIDKIVPVVRNDAHRLIEECMLAANVCASEFLKKHQQAALYRIHEGPTPEKLINLRNFLKEFGLDLKGGDEPHAKDYAALLAKIKDRPDAQLLQTVMLRSLQQAVYSPENVGHFGLAYESYTHFTSPIRRYPDLLIHRAIKAALEGKNYNPGNWQELGAHCSATER